MSRNIILIFKVYKVMLKQYELFKHYFFNFFFIFLISIIFVISFIFLFFLISFYLKNIFSGYKKESFPLFSGKLS